MPAPHNTFKAALKSGETQIGLWVALADPYTAQISAGAGFDWLLIDAEHAPNDIRSVLAQLQAVAPYPAHPVVRPPIGETWLIKQLLDIGVQSLLVPMVDSADQARELVRAVRYPPHGVRGVGAGLARASDFNRIPDYLPTADAEICLLVQIESLTGVAALDEILEIGGVDGVFIGPSDLAADMGHLGDPGATPVQEVVNECLDKIIASDKAAGILIADQDLLRGYIDKGAAFVAVGTDVAILSKGTAALAKTFKP